MAKSNLDKIKKVEKYNLERIKGIHQTLVAKDLLRKQFKDRYNDQYFSKGIEWFESGLSLDEAPEEIRNHASFISGFNHGKRVKFVNESLYDLGADYFQRNIPLSDIPENYRNNKFFLDGYNAGNIEVHKK